jgi:SecD/SecF fusion protein
VRSVSIWRIVFVLAIIGVSIYYVYPSFVWYTLPREDRIEFKTDEIRQLEQELHQMDQERQETEDTDEAATLSAQMTQLSEQIDDLRGNLKGMQDAAIPLGLDLKGGIHVVLRVQFDESDEEQKYYVVDQVIESLRNRIDSLGVREPQIQRQGTDRILVQIPSITDPAEVLEVIGTTARLEFRFAKENEGDYSETAQVLAKIDEALPAAQLMDKVRYVGGQWSPPWILEEDYTYFQENLFVRNEKGHFISELKPEVKNQLPYGYTLMFGNKETFQQTENQAFNRRAIYLVSEKPELTGQYLTNASVQLDTAGLGNAYVAFSLNSEGAAIFSRVTGNNINRALAIVLDNTVYSAPRIESKIAGGQGQITGQFDLDEAKTLAVILRAGALPASVTVEESRVIDPTLGADSINKGIFAGLLGSAVVVLFMLIYYSLSGVVAVIALALNVLIVAAALAMIPATLTLPGIAGAILIVGMAVDANVLIFERIREEMTGRVGRAVPLIVDRGFGRAFGTILDANMTTFITAVVLFQFGTGPVKGFAVTLSLGILISMFTAVYVGRLIFDLMTGPMNIKKLHVGTLRIFKDTHVNFLSFRKMVLTFSIIVIVIGLVYTIATGEGNLGVDLTSGSSMVFRFQETVEENQVRQALEANGIPGAQIYKFANAPNELVVRTKQLELPQGVTSAGSFVERILRQELEGRQPILLSDDTVGPTVGRELISKSIWALIASVVFIIIYIAIRFEFGYAIAAIAALLHDVLFTVGIFCMTNMIPGQHREINLPIIAALLTIIGYSLNDTIVVFDRVRENRRPGKGTFDEVINSSINQTLSRTFITSLTTLLVVLSLFLFGGAGISDFAYTLLIGVVVGTYSSIFIASPVLLWWHSRQHKKRSASY